MSKEKSAAELLKDELCLEKKHFVSQMSDEELKKADDYCEGYKEFLALPRPKESALTS